MKEFSDFDPRNDTRFAVIPGVLHNSSEWGMELLNMRSTH